MKKFSQLVFFISVFLLKQNVLAYTVKEYQCPVIVKDHSLAIKTITGSTWGKVSQQANVMRLLSSDLATKQDRKKVLEDLFFISKNRMQQVIDVYTDALRWVEADQTRSEFFYVYAKTNNINVDRYANKALSHKRLKQCTGEALKQGAGVHKSDYITTVLHHNNSEQLGSIDSSSLFARVNQAVLMCQHPGFREAQKEKIYGSIDSFETIITNYSDLFNNRSDLNTKRSFRESRFQIQLLLGLFPNLGTEYLRYLNAEGNGFDKFDEVSSKISNHEKVSDQEVNDARVALVSIAQVCHVDRIMDIRKVFSDILVSSSVAVTIASLAFGPVFGITLLPAILNSGTTLGILLGINSFSASMSLVDAVLMSKDVRKYFAEAKIAKAVIQPVKYQREVLRILIKRIKETRLDPESDLSKVEIKEARKTLVKVINALPEYKDVMLLYDRLNSAKFNQIRQVFFLAMFTVGLAPTANYHQALYRSIGQVKGASSGLNVMKVISNFEDTSDVFSAISYSNIVVGAGLTVGTVQYSFHNLNYAQVQYIKQLLESALN